MNNSPRLDALDKRTLRNYIMNSDLRYWQRNNSALIGNGTSEYVADRFLTGPGIDGVAGSQTTYSRSTDLPDTDVNFSMQAVGAYAVGEEFSIIQRIESTFATDFSGEKASLRFYYKSDGVSDVRVKLQEPTALDNFSTTSTIYSQTIPAVSDSTWQEILIENVDVGVIANGLEMHVTFISSTLGTVTTKFAKPQLNIGEEIDQYTLFTRDTVEELMYCQRYFEKSYNIDTPLGTVIDVGAIAWDGPNTSNPHSMLAFFATEKRVQPVATIYNPNTGEANRYNRGGVSTAPQFATFSTRGGTFGGAGISTSGSNGHWAADAEL